MRVFLENFIARSANIAERVTRIFTVRAARYDQPKAIVKPAIAYRDCDKFAEALAAIKSASNEIKEGAEDMRNALNDSAAKLKNQIALSKDLAARNRTIARLAERTNVSLSASAKSIGANLAQADAIKVGKEMEIAAVMRLAAQSQKAREYLREIDALTTQARALSFNGSLEAASAGESGKRFLVIAQEIERMATDAAIYTRNFRGWAEELSEACNSFVIAGESSLEQISVSKKMIASALDEIGAVKSQSEIIMEECDRALEASDLSANAQSEVKEKELELTRNALIAENAEKIALIAETLSKLLKEQALKEAN
ncbi:MAG: methyl-accepting chemotaxis protein [Helicobacteraceae bacterium]|jgi:methyl-accepting chemotaxis protein|nr:methyl-accepting chemotaxis protein [Helicobacteraceae bacterium]